MWEMFLFYKRIDETAAELFTVVSECVATESCFEVARLGDGFGNGALFKKFMKLCLGSLSL